MLGPNLTPTQPVGFLAGKKQGLLGIGGKGQINRSAERRTLANVLPDRLLDCSTNLRIRCPPAAPPCCTTAVSFSTSLNAGSSRHSPSRRCSVSIDGFPYWLASYRAKNMARRAYSVKRSNMLEGYKLHDASPQRRNSDGFSGAAFCGFSDACSVA
jgi:hypothetical protein